MLTKIDYNKIYTKLAKTRDGSFCLLHQVGAKLLLEINNKKHVFDVYLDCRSAYKNSDVTLFEGYNELTHEYIHELMKLHNYYFENWQDVIYSFIDKFKNLDIKLNFSQLQELHNLIDADVKTFVHKELHKLTSVNLNDYKLDKRGYTINKHTNKITSEVY